VAVAQIIRSLSARAFRLTIGGVGRAVPRRFRFRYVRFVARLFRSVIVWRLGPVNGLGLLNSELTLSLGYVIRTMTDCGCEFVLPMRVSGEESIPDQASLFVSGHLLLAGAGVRFLSERGVPLMLVRPTEDEYRLLGTRTRIPIFAYGEKLLLVRMRNALRAGTSVVALLDDASTGRLIIRPQALAAAVKSRLPIVFFGAYMGDEGKIEVVFARPRGSEVTDIAAELLAFIKSLAPPA
jgi:hypothetical protein